jgi:GNAT superfamily N-acetyltransferase
VAPASLPDGVLLRRLEPEDSLEELTELLHRSYAPLLAAGMRYFASHQDVEATRKRCEAGECWVLSARGRLIGTVTFRDAGRASGTPHYDRPDVACAGQLCVDPAWQGLGLGGVLMDLVERRARETGAAELAFDTSERATRLIATYARRGYAEVDRCQWDVTNYRSVVLSKRL